MFGLYERFDQTKECKGMGLYMIKTQVETMEGTIDVASSVDEGTEFRITLPVAKAPGNSIEPPVSTLDLGPDYSALAERA